MTDELKATTKSYLMVMAWWYLWGTDEKTTPEKIEKALAKIAVAETKLREAGITDEGLKELGDRAEKFVKTPVDEMTRNQQETFAQLIFGPKVAFDKDNLEYMRDAQGHAVRDEKGKLTPV